MRKRVTKSCTCLICAWFLDNQFELDGKEAILKDSVGIKSPAESEGSGNIRSHYPHALYYNPYAASCK
jgi:hypothetical protein